MGNSDKCYHLASEFPYFMQEEFPNLRFRPKPRVHPRSFFVDDTSLSASRPLSGYSIYDTTPAFQNKFKEAEAKIFPQAARFRVFAYVYAEDDSRWPDNVFEVTADLGHITWTLNLANKKSLRSITPATPFENTATATLDTSAPTLKCNRLRTSSGLPNLAYMFLERNDADTSKVTGRMHVIGNEGDLVGSTRPRGLWSDDWYDGEADGSVAASVIPLSGLLAKVGGSAADIKFLEYNTEGPLGGDAPKVEAMPAWCVVGCPDYVPDMGHFVSLWDLSFDRAYHNLVARAAVTQPGKHKLVVNKNDVDATRMTDYRIHIHPIMCLFADVRFVSGEAFGEPVSGGVSGDRGHNKSPVLPPPTTGTKDEIEKKAIERGGVRISARAQKADLENPTKLKADDRKKPINEWLKIAVFQRLRKPTTLYDVTRKFMVRRVSGSPPTLEPGTFPRKFGRRHDYDKPPGPDSDNGLMFQVPDWGEHGGNLRKYHGLADSGKLCGGDAAPPTAGPPGTSFTADELKALKLVDDTYWPATFSDMPMLRELAFPPTLYDQFKAWQASDTDVRLDYLFREMLPPSLRKSFGTGTDAEAHFANVVAKIPKYAPTLIDMAHLGAMLGGSFLAGIEVGREGGVSTNWCMYHGATHYFPSIRFKPCDVPAEHPIGHLTKDLAIPWTFDFEHCTEDFWPTSRPGRTTKTGTTRLDWMIWFPDPPDPAAPPPATPPPPADVLPHLGRAPHDLVEFYKEYWKALSFIRRDASDQFLEKEQTWH